MIPSLLIHGLDPKNEKNRRVHAVPADQCSVKSGMEHSGVDFACFAFLAVDQHLVVYSGFGILDFVYTVWDVDYKLGVQMRK